MAEGGAGGPGDGCFRGHGGQRVDLLDGGVSRYQNRFRGDRDPNPRCPEGTGWSDPAGHGEFSPVMREFWCWL